MIIPRRLSNHIRKMLGKFPVVSLTGPRQSGKTTLLQNDFPDYHYFNLERLDTRELIHSDPSGFLKRSGSRIILDEVQNMPDLFSYIQTASDERNTTGQYILSGSQSFLLSDRISQSLAGRVSVNNLLPFDITELKHINKLDIPSLILKGFYPRLHDKNIDPADFYPSYLQTYIERDLRTLKAVDNLQTFSRFLGLCAGRTGQILNLSSLANDAGIAVNTVKSWLSLLESSYIIFTLQPWHQNFNKRIIKSPKLYFYDTGVASSLLRLTDPEVLHTHYLYGALFENLIISEIIKCHLHKGKQPRIYFWRESNGNEIDCIIDRGNDGITAIEIKAGESFNAGYLKNLILFSKGEKTEKIRKMVVYNGTYSTSTNNIEVLTWPEFVENIGTLLA